MKNFFEINRALAAKKNFFYLALAAKKKFFVLLISAVALVMTSCGDGGNAPENVPPPPEGEIKGLFSVDENKQVYFSKGNLQYVGTWQFAENQWETFGANQSDDHRDLFGWGTGNNPNNVSPWGYSEYAEWGNNPITNGGNQPNQWRTLEKKEWEHLFLHRENAEKLFSMGTVKGVKGVIVLPDNWPSDMLYEDNEEKGLIKQSSGAYSNAGKSNFTLHTYDENQWKAMQDNGAVFLPVTGSRNGTNVDDLDEGYYWTPSHDDYLTNDLCFLNFDSQYLLMRCNRSEYGFAVRLVQNAKPSDVSFNIQVKDVDAFSGIICINPSNKNVWYFWGWDTKANFYENSKDAKTVINAMMENKKYELMGEDMTFEQYLEWMKKQGNIEGFTKGDHEKEINSFDPGKEYVVYACIVNKDAEVVGKVTTREFTTSDTEE